ncbi:iron complex transport system substrate-binding protein [Streptomyces sp. 2224.1]|uniref:ABC transporter substrate-binding protein n=1 Tax=unclassified Streptomyces TaxID=2593676 RepID=UPI000884221E|nr:MULTISPECIES: ABC transporter substrate-binding protein [unclassified Streptomyces]PBC80547.1 iron complex transport system substrate-binding protein [Streptomyces sp. 2321.6]SDR58144.1 iron complex transport system substrate-binding protein [Streptomyces sp. KS_16]SEB79004.1 iron complex transport system substrate-binding protein [Streptomyces sp. 2133.1]SED45812.1 iron complex transport system substrate-binding protein [Streptomyces sp. 2224.1]SNC60967.1 iron complex transport system subs
MRSRVWGGTAAVVLGGLLVAGCGGWEKDAADGSTGDAGKSAGGSYPVSVTDCKGAKTTFSGAPKRIVTSNASSLELLLRLGAGDKVIGTGFPPGKGTLPGALDAQGQQVKVLSRNVIPKEKLLGSGADLYIDTFASMGGMGGGGMGDAPTAEEFEAAGIKHLYLKSTACAAQGKEPVRDLSAVEADITSLGAVTGTSAKAKEIVAGMKEKVDAVQKAVGGTAAAKRPAYFFFDYDAGTKQPTVVCNRQVANAVITLAGARNAFADCEGDNKQVGWEDVIAKNPDWIQLGVRNRGSEAANEKAFDEAQKWLETNPATKGLKAVKEGHFLRIGSEPTTIAGVENAETVEKIAKTLYPGKVG